jgi:hypothetical protein
MMNLLRRLACRWLGLRDPREWAASENRLMALHAAESYAIEVEIEQRLGEVPEALRRLDAALEPYVDQRRCVETLPVQELVWGEWPEEQEYER